MKSILEPDFVYTSSLHTDIRLTFARIKREQAERALQERQRKAEDEARWAKHLKDCVDNVESIELVSGGPVLRQVK